MQEDNIFKRTERALYEYKDLPLKIKSIDADIECLENDITLKAISYEEKSGPTNAFNSSVENEVIRRDEKVSEYITRLKRDKLLYKNRMIKIELALESLTEQERKLVELRYFTRPKYEWLKIGLELNIDGDWCMKLRNRIINKLSEFIFN